MTAFFVWIEKKGPGKVDASIAKSMLESVSGYGGNHRELMVSDRFAIGFHGRWELPEEVGEKQPLVNDRETVYFVFEGRIDNRKHLLNELGIDDALSDSQLCFNFVERCGISRIAEIIGPFCFALFNLATGELVCARDSMGGRYLVKFESEERIIVANVEECFIPLPEVGHNLNKVKIVAWLANQIDGSPRTCLRNLEQICPGEKLVWKADGNTTQRSTFYRPNPNRRIQLASDEEYAREFRRLLDQAVHRRMRSIAKVGVLLSGGMDSSPIMVAAAKDSDVIALSWVFDDMQEADERTYSTPLCQRLGVRQVEVKCDDIWPDFDSNTHSNPLYPFMLPYSEFQQQTFKTAQDENVSVLLSGLQGDLLYELDNTQVVNQLRRREWRKAWRELESIRRERGYTYWQAVKTLLLKKLPGVKKWTRHRESKIRQLPAWIQDDLRNQLTLQDSWLMHDSRLAARPLQYKIVLDCFAGDDQMLGRVMENKYRVQRRYPFRDRELVEFLLAIPSEQLEFLGQKRPIVKSAYQNEFTVALRQRNDKTDFTGVLKQGISKDKKWLTILNLEPKFWQKYVKECHFTQIETVSIEKQVVLWQCAYYNFWHRIWYDSAQEGMADLAKKENTAEQNYVENE